MHRLQGAIDYLLVISRRLTAHRSSLTAGGLAYFVALGLAPAALAVGWLAGIVLTPEQVRESLSTAATGATGVAGRGAGVADSVASLIESSSTAGMSIASFIGVVIAIYAASRTVYGLRLALNSAYGVPERYRGFVERVAATVITVVGIGVLVVLIILLTVLPKMLSLLGLSSLRVSTGSWVVDWLLMALLIWLGCWGVLARGANHRLKMPAWSPGPLIAAAAIIAATAGVGIYVRASNAMGAAIALFGSALVVLLWLYLCFFGLLIGAEVEAQRHGLGGVPEETPANA